MAEAAEQRYTDFLGGETKYTSDAVHQLTITSSPIEREFYEFYPFEDIKTISPRSMFFITGENAHSREFSENAYQLAAEPKELYIVPGAEHVDLYDRVSLIPFNKLEFFIYSYQYCMSATAVDRRIG